MPFTTALDNAVADHVLGGPNYTRVANVYIGLSSTTPTKAGGNITEPVGGGYARVLKPNDVTNWPAAAASLKSNGTVITFPPASATWAAGANMTHMVIWNDPTGTATTNVIAWGAMTTPKPVLSGDTASFAIGAVDLQLGP
jgi:hypothetical protein